MGMVIRETILSQEASRMESGFFSVVMFTVYFLWSLCVFELTGIPSNWILTPYNN
jgi:hypothetical protein